VIPEARLLAWERQAVEASVRLNPPAGYNAMLEEDRRRWIRADLVRDAFPQLLRELRALRQAAVWSAQIARDGDYVELQQALDAAGFEWRHRCGSCGVVVEIPDPRCADETLCTACGDALEAELP
jgi:hypothetical protein